MGQNHDDLQKARPSRDGHTITHKQTILKSLQIKLCRIFCFVSWCFAFPFHCTYALPTSEYAQILHIDGNHWIVISTIDQASDTVAVYDSLQCKSSKAITDLIVCYNHSPAPKLVISIMNEQAQINSHDCGMYALGFINALLHHQDPMIIDFLEPRSHLAQSLRSTPTCTRTPITALQWISSVLVME